MSRERYERRFRRDWHPSRGRPRARCIKLLRRPLTGCSSARASRTSGSRPTSDAHRRLIQVVNGGGNAVSTQNGDVTLDLKEILTQAEQRYGVGGRVAQKLPADAAQVTILRSDQLSLAQDSAHLLRALAIVLPALAILLFALAVYLARGWRREALRATGLGLALAGAAALVARTLAGHVVVDALVTTESVRPAIQATWTIETSLLKQAAIATLAYGVVVFLGAWPAGRRARPGSVAASRPSCAIRRMHGAVLR